MGGTQTFIGRITNKRKEHLKRVRIIKAQRRNLREPLIDIAEATSTLNDSYSKANVTRPEEEMVDPLFVSLKTEIASDEESNDTEGAKDNDETTPKEKFSIERYEIREEEIEEIIRERQILEEQQELLRQERLGKKLKQQENEKESSDDSVWETDEYLLSLIPEEEGATKRSSRIRDKLIKGLRQKRKFERKKLKELRKKQEFEKESTPKSEDHGCEVNIILHEENSTEEKRIEADTEVQEVCIEENEDSENSEPDHDGWDPPKKKRMNQAKTVTEPQLKRPRGRPKTITKNALEPGVRRRKSRKPSCPNHTAAQTNFGYVDPENRVQTFFLNLAAKLSNYPPALVNKAKFEIRNKIGQIQMDVLEKMKNENAAKIIERAQKRTQRKMKAIAVRDSIIIID